MVSSCSLATSSLAPPIVPTLLWRWPQTAKHVHKWLDQLINSKAPTIVNKISTGRAFTDRIQSLCCLWVSRPCQPLRPSCYEQVRLKGTNLRWFSRKKTGPQRQSWHEIWIDMWYVKQGQWFGNLWSGCLILLLKGGIWFWILVLDVGYMIYWFTLQTGEEEEARLSARGKQPDQGWEEGEMAKAFADYPSISFFTMLTNRNTNSNKLSQTWIEAFEKQQKVHIVKSACLFILE